MKTKIAAIVSAMLVSTLIGQVRPDLKNVILVYIKPSAMDFPSDKVLVPVSELVIRVPGLREAFQKFGVESISKGFPGLNDRDTSAIRNDGTRVKLPQFSRVFQ